MKALALAALLILTPLTGAAGELRTFVAESLRVTIDSDWATRTAPGYVPVRFDITNLGDARVIDIVGEGSRFTRYRRGGVGGLHILRTVRLARGDRVRITIPVPVFAESENHRFEIQEGGETLQQFSYMGFQSNTPAASASALIVAASSTPLGTVAGTLPRPVTSGSSGIMVAGPSSRSSAALDFLLEPARLPADWLGYTSLRAVVIGSEEWASLEDAQRGALLTWTACGGDLIVASGDAPPIAGVGHRLPAPSADGTPRPYFFGRIYRRPAAAIAASGLAGVLSEMEARPDPHWGLPANRMLSWNTVGPRGFRLTIPGVSGVPARAYLSILILFAFLIGPVNYWFLWRRRRPVLFVLTAPLTSAVFIVLLAGYVIAGEGFHVSGRAVTFTMLDQARRQAVTRSSASFYAAGMTPGGGLRFPRDVAVFPIGSDGAGGRDSQTLDLTTAQQFSSGVIHARTPTNLEQVAFRTARERLTFERANGGLRAVNGLGATVEHLVLRSEGRVYGLEGPLRDGATAMLKAGPVSGQDWVPRDVPMPPRFLQLFDTQAEGSYLAVLDRSPFWEPGLAGVLEHRSFHLVLGWPDGQPGGPGGQ